MTDGFDELSAFLDDLAQRTLRFGATAGKAAMFVIDDGVWATRAELSLGPVPVVSPEHWDPIPPLTRDDLGPGALGINMQLAEIRDGRAFVKAVTRWTIRFLPQTSTWQSSLPQPAHFNREADLRDIPEELRPLWKFVKDHLSMRGYEVREGEPDWRFNAFD